MPIFVIYLIKTETASDKKKQSFAACYSVRKRMPLKILIYYQKLATTKNETNEFRTENVCAKANVRTQ